MIKGPIRLRASAKNNPQVAEYLAAAARGARDHHVVAVDGSWAVRSAAAKASKVFASQKEAIRYGKTIAKEQRTELFIHGRDGRIRARNSYGRDPFPPKG